MRSRAVAGHLKSRIRKTGGQLRRLWLLRQLDDRARWILSSNGLTARFVPGSELFERTWLIMRSGLFDQEWYEAQVGKSFPGTRAAIKHYLTRGWRAGIGPHPLVSPRYLAAADLATARSDPFVRYLTDPALWDRSPHPLFDPAAYLARYPQAAEHKFGPLAHFAATAGEHGPVPLPPRFSTAVLRWGLLRERLIDHAELLRRHRSLVEVKRITAQYDWTADRDFVDTWTGRPIPAPGTGGPIPAPGTGGPIVSVVMAVHNRETQVRAAIESVLTQTMPHWELIVVDDGSTDKTAQLVAELAESDDRIRLLRTEHVGVSHARNAGSAACTGRYVAWLDSDNTWVPHFLQVMVAVMRDRGLSVAYAGAAQVTGELSRYRVLSGGIELLEVINHIDLNVLVVDRALLDDIGGFDESMRRMVDYDLIWRLLRRTEAGYVPFIGVVYDHSKENSDRISMREPRSWREVTKNKHLIDWPALESGLGRRTDRVSVVVSASPSWRETFDVVLSALGDGPPDVEVIIFDEGSTRQVSFMLAAISAVDPCVRLVRSPDRVGRPLGRNLAFAQTTGSRIVFVDGQVEPRSGWLAALVAPLVGDEVLGAQPLVLDPDGTIYSAGAGFVAGEAYPVRFLAGLPAQDAERMGARIAVKAITWTSMSVRAADFVAMRGFDPLYPAGGEDVDLCLRIGSSRLGEFTVATNGVVRRRRKPGPPEQASWPAISQQVFRSRWAGRTPSGDERLWRAAGFEILDYRADDEPDGPAGLVQPVLGWVAEPRGSAEYPALRWAIKTAVPAKGRSESWGDLHFARALAAALGRLGQAVAIDYRESADRESSSFDDVVLGLRGLRPVRPQPGRVNLLWVISHPDLVDGDEMRGFDHVFAASAPWAAEVSVSSGVAVSPLLQATDAGRFQPHGAVPGTGPDVLFVGNSRRDLFRPTVRHLIEAGVDVAIYGIGWEAFVDPRHIKGQRVPNDQLPALYRSAGVVLNDHWDDMRTAGFISNRLFDAVAAGARVISDDIAGSQEIFGSAVRTYRTPEELVRLVKTPVAKLFPADDELLEISRRVRSEHSFDQRAALLVEAALRLRANTAVRS